jgi:hypothetical protein
MGNSPVAFTRGEMLPIYQVGNAAPANGISGEFMNVAN